MSRALALACLAAALLAPPRARAQASSPLQSADVEERLGERLPLDLTFTSAEGRAVRLGSAFAGGRPVLLVLAYTRCEMLCPLVLHGLAAGVRAAAARPGEEYRVLTVSLDPRDSPADARAVRSMLVREAGLPAGSAGWRVWTGEEPAIRALADRLGFRYRYDPVTDQFAHPAVAFVLTPAGTVSRYLYGTDFRPAELDLALADARAGRSGSAFERVLLRCYHYVPALRRYGPAVAAFLRGGAGLVMLALGTMILWLWRRDPGRGGAA